MAAPQWDNLNIDRRAAPRTLSDQQFRDWMTDRPIFVSSVMDDEMNPARSTIRAWIHEWGGEPVMWEEITPRDQHPQDAYLNGVDRSNIFVLLLGSRYGIADDTGYSPTHKEANRAKDQGLTRLLLEPTGLQAVDRDGRVNDWLRSLYNEVSAGRYTDSKDLTRQLEKRLRELANAHETPWVKLGPIIVPGSVRQRTNRGETEFIVNTTVRDPTVRRVLSELSGWQSRVRVDRLTWDTVTHPVNVGEMDVQSATTSEDEVTVTCQLATSRLDAPMHVGLNGGYGRTIGAAEQAALWTRRAVLGEEFHCRDSTDLLYSFTEPDGPTLPHVLSAYQAQGWLAEGITRLYLVEGLVTKYGGHFERLEIGPATAASVRVDFVFRLNDYERSPVEIKGTVPRH